MMTPASLVETRARRVKVSAELLGEGVREGRGGEPAKEEGEMEKRRHCECLPDSSSDWGWGEAIVEDGEEEGEQEMDEGGDDGDGFQEQLLRGSWR